MQINTDNILKYIRHPLRFTHEIATISGEQWVSDPCKLNVDFGIIGEHNLRKRLKEADSEKGLKFKFEKKRHMIGRDKEQTYMYEIIHLKETETKTPIAVGWMFFTELHHLINAWVSESCHLWDIKITDFQNFELNKPRAIELSKATSLMILNLISFLRVFVQNVYDLNEEHLLTNELHLIAALKILRLVISISDLTEGEYFNDLKVYDYVDGLIDCVFHLANIIVGANLDTLLGNKKIPFDKDFDVKNLSSLFDAMSVEMSSDQSDIRGSRIGKDRLTSIRYSRKSRTFLRTRSILGDGKLDTFDDSPTNPRAQMIEIVKHCSCVLEDFDLIRRKRISLLDGESEAWKFQDPEGSSIFDTNMERLSFQSPSSPSAPEQKDEVKIEPDENPPLTLETDNQKVVVNDDLEEYKKNGSLDFAKARRELKNNFDDNTEFMRIVQNCIKLLPISNNKNFVNVALNTIVDHEELYQAYILAKTSILSKAFKQVDHVQLEAAAFHILKMVEREFFRDCNIDAFWNQWLDVVKRMNGIEFAIIYEFLLHYKRNKRTTLETLSEALYKHLRVKMFKDPVMYLKSMLLSTSLPNQNEHYGATQMPVWIFKTDNQFNLKSHIEFEKELTLCEANSYCTKNFSNNPKLSTTVRFPFQAEMKGLINHLVEMRGVNDKDPMNAFDEVIKLPEDIWTDLEFPSDFKQGLLQPYSCNQMTDQLKCLSIRFMRPQLPLYNSLCELHSQKTEEILEQVKNILSDK